MNDLVEQNESDSSPNYRGIAIFLIAIVAWLTSFLWNSDSQSAVVVHTLIMAVVISLAIWQACDPFAEAAQWVGCRFRIPGSVRGATLDAIASSMPELFSGIFFVSVALTSGNAEGTRLAQSAEGYGSTLATCAGSSIYNMLLIPATCAIAVSFWRRSSPSIEISSEVIHRDGLWVVGCQFGLLVFLFMPELHWWMAVVAIVTYFCYIGHLLRDTVVHRKSTKDVENPLEDMPDRAELFFGLTSVRITAVTAWVILVLGATAAAVACYFLVELTNETAAKLSIEPFFVAVILAAAVSSVPDTFMSLGAATRGDDSGAISNAFGSNIFDICIGLSIPLVVCSYLNDWGSVPLTENGLPDGTPLAGVVGLRSLLFVLTMVSMFMMWRRRQITRKMGFFFVGLYLVFMTYAVLGSLEIISA